MQIEGKTVTSAAQLEKSQSTPLYSRFDTSGFGLSVPSTANAAKSVREYYHD
jgi:hypothetical protein